MFWLQNVYRLRGQPLFGAPAERNVLIEEYSNYTFRSAGAKNLIDGSNL